MARTGLFRIAVLTMYSMDRIQLCVSHDIRPLASGLCSELVIDMCDMGLTGGLIRSPYFVYRILS